MTQIAGKEPAARKDTFWEKFDQVQNARAGSEPEWLRAIRNAGVARFAETGFPTVQDEDWRFTNVAPIAKLPFHPVLSRTTGGASREAMAGLTFAGLKGCRLVFVDGHYAPELSVVNETGGGIRIVDLASALREDLDVAEKHLGRSSHAGQNAFLALNTAFFTDGLLVYVPAGQRVAEPIQLLHLGTRTQPGAASHIRNLIVVENGGAVTVIENYASLVRAPQVTNVATELVLGEGARVEHCKFQDESAAAYHLATIHAELGRQANLVAHSFALGAKLSRNDIRTVLGGEGIECVLNGLYLTTDEQLADHHMIVDHAQPHCNSHEYFNGILDGRSRGVFHGRILVRPDAQKTDAKQTNKNLLLSDDAGVNTKPQLEIYADDVKCTHGATIGQMNEESIFYLRARGIGAETARRMLMHAFAGEIIERIQHEDVKDELDKVVWNRLEQNQHITVAAAHV